MGKPKIFVLDTNVILHDHNAIHKFKDNYLVIPVAVIEEADKFKKGNDTLSYNARHFMRDMDRLKDDHIKIEPNHPFAPEFAELFRDDIQDHRILATAMWVRDNNPGTFVALVSKDVNLRLKAKAAGMECQDYLTDRLEEDKIERANAEVQFRTLPQETMQALCYGPETAVPWDAVDDKEP